MNGYLYIGLILIMVFMLLKNAKKAKTLRKDKGYVDAYMKVLKKEENAYEELKSYIENEKDDELKNRAKIVEVYAELINDNDPSELISSIDLNAALLVEGKADVEKLKTNSDTFVWLNLDVVKAYSENKLKVMAPIYNGLISYDNELNSFVEYNLFKSIYDYLNTKDEAALDFLKKLLAGEYGGMNYDKQLIGVSKKTAATLLAYSKQPLDDYGSDFLKEFATTQVGNRLMKDLGIIDEYLEKEEVKEEDK